MTNESPQSVDDMPQAGPAGQSSPPQPSDLLQDPQFRARFEQTSAALEAAELVRQMRQQALSSSGLRGISQDELAARAGLSQPRISQIEKGSGRDGVSYALLRKIAYACGIEWGDMLREALAGLSKAKTGDHRTAAAGYAPPPLTYKGHYILDRQGVLIGTISGVLIDESGDPAAVRAGKNEGQIFDIKNLTHVLVPFPHFIVNGATTESKKGSAAAAEGILSCGMGPVVSPATGYYPPTGYHLAADLTKDLQDLAKDFYKPQAGTGAEKG